MKGWDLPMGDRPSARFTRVSAPQHEQPHEQPTLKTAQPAKPRATKIQQPTKITSTTTDESDCTTDKSPPTPNTTSYTTTSITSLVGSVVERTSSTTNAQTQAPATTTTTARSMSRFAQQQQQQRQQLQQQQQTTGFPSLDVPLGAFVRNKNKQQQLRQQPRQSTLIQKNNSKSSSPRKAAATSSAIIGGGGPHHDEDDDESSDFKNSSSLDELRLASSRDANAMLARMSPLEIQESIRDLKATLSPEIIALFSRKQDHRNQEQGQLSSTASVAAATTTAAAAAAATAAAATTNEVAVVEREEEEERERKEKERFARVLSSIQTYEDLDEAYAKEILHNDKNNNYNDSHQASTSNDNDTKNMQEEEEDGNNNNNNGDDDFALACQLLRSTSRRQNVWAAKTVAEHLLKNLRADRYCSLKGGETFGVGETGKQVQEEEAVWPYPLLLPVSLRCLLDTPLPPPLPPSSSSSSSFDRNGYSHYILHTYVLQSIYYLLQLRACRDHVVTFSQDNSISKNGSTHCNINDKRNNVNNNHNHDDHLGSIYQLHFLDDAVPTPRLGLCYPSSTAAASTTDEQDVSILSSYDTSSKSSAVSDAKAFCSDPLWTLVSKMRILPRIAVLLQHQHRQQEQSSVNASSITTSTTSTPHYPLPREATIAICGILAMVAQRTPGAASAIVQHATILKDLLVLTTLTPTMTRNDDDNHHDKSSSSSSSTSCMDPSLAIPAVRLLCFLARQSRLAAQGIDLEAFVYRVFVVSDGTFFAPTETTTTVREEADKVDTNKQQSWRRLQQWTLVLWRTLLRYGLGLELTSSLMLTVAVPQLTLGPGPRSFLAPEIFTALAQVARCVRVARKQQHQQHGTREQGKQAILPEETMQVLAQSEACLRSTIRFALKHLSNQEGRERSPDEASKVRQLRFYGSCLRFVDSFVAMQYIEDLDMSKTDGLTASEEESCITALLALVKSKDFRDTVGYVVSRIFAEPDDSLPSANDLKLEAASSFYLESTIAITSQLENYRYSTSSLSKSSSSDASATALGLLREALGEALHSEIIASASNPSHWRVRQAADCPKPRLGWQNRVLTTACSFLASSKQAILHPEATRALAFYTIGRLQCGDESRGAILWSYDWLFRTTSLLRYSESPVSTMLVRELCRTPTARSQLDHSFKLAGGFGITSSSGLGPFELQSLLSESDHGNPSSNYDDLLLPIGPLWLWQMLSGVIVPEQNHPQEQERLGEKNRDVVEIISASLQLILEMESSKDDLACQYTNGFETGGKLYYVSNICLQPEYIFRDDRIQSCLESLLDRYAVAPDGVSGSFISTCLVHSSTKGSKTTSEGKKSSSAEEEQVKRILSPPEDATKGPLSQEALSVLGDFVGDLCDAYVEYGAQYPSFTKCLRRFFLPVFPLKIRCAVLQKVRGLVHLLTLEQDGSLRNLLPRYLNGGLPSVDQSSKDAPEFLDTICTVYSKTSGSRLDYGFVMSFAIAVLARSLAMCLLSDEGGLTACKRRLTLLDRAFCTHVIQTTYLFLSSTGTVSDLVDAALASNITKEEAFPASTVAATLEATTEWDSLWIPLRSVSSPALL